MEKIDPDRVYSSSSSSLATADITDVTADITTATTITIPTIPAKIIKPASICTPFQNRGNPVTFSVITIPHGWRHCQKRGEYSLLRLRNCVGVQPRTILNILINAEILLNPLLIATSVTLISGSSRSFSE